jgi:excisionase family DNA binding protein
VKKTGTVLRGLLSNLECPALRPDEFDTVESTMSDEDNSLRLLSVGETAKILKVKDPRVYELARLKLLPAVRLGRQVRINEQRLREWIANGGSALGAGWNESASERRKSVVGPRTRPHESAAFPVMPERIMLLPEIHAVVRLSRTTIWRGPVSSSGVLVGAGRGMAGTRIEGAVGEAIGGAGWRAELSLPKWFV